MQFAAPHAATTSRHRRGLPCLLAIVRHQYDRRPMRIRRTPAEHEVIVRRLTDRAAAKLDLFPANIE